MMHHILRDCQLLIRFIVNDLVRNLADEASVVAIAYLVPYFPVTPTSETHSQYMVREKRTETSSNSLFVRFVILLTAKDVFAIADRDSIVKRLWAASP